MFDLSYYIPICRMVYLYNELIVYFNMATQLRTIEKKEVVDMFKLQYEYEVLVSIYQDYMNWYLINHTSKKHQQVISMLSVSEPFEYSRRETRYLYQ